jgi:hypothetical protein
MKEMKNGNRQETDEEGKENKQQKIYRIAKTWIHVAFRTSKKGRQN